MLNISNEFSVYEKSLQVYGETSCAIVKNTQGNKFLYTEGKSLEGLKEGEKSGKGYLYPLNSENAFALSELFPYLKSKALGIGKPSFGFGDRLGLATPGHVQAVRESSLVPIFAQQSIREMERTKRTPSDVMRDAIWGVFQEGYTHGFGSDADHLKTEEDVKNTAKAGFRMFTCDPSDYVNNSTDTLSVSELRKEFEKIKEKDALLSVYEGKSFTIGDENLIFSGETLMRAVVKYQKAVEHAEHMYKIVKSNVDGDFDFELSIDETEEPTTPAQHIFIVNELLKRDVKLTSIAPRFVGDFQKAIDYIGDLNEFENQFKLHIKIAKKFGPYKISVHSGSDKFSIYPIISKYGDKLFHVKTAGTSYLEALRLIAISAPALFKEIVKFSIERFAHDRKSYHLTTVLSNIADIDTLSETDYQSYLDKNDSRQMLHVTYGSVLNSSLKDAFMNTLKEHEKGYNEILVKHFRKHLSPLEG